MIIKYREDASTTESVIDIVANPRDDKIKKIMQIIYSNDQRILITKNQKTHLVDKDSIYYLEAIDNTVFIYLESEFYESNYKLYELIEMLPISFIRVSKSTVVNLMHVKSIENYFNNRLLLQLSNKEKVLVNRSYVREFKERLKMR